MPSKNVLPHINSDQLIKMKIPAFQGRESEHNRIILEDIALNGPSLKYGLFKRLKEKGFNYASTVSRRVINLADKGYLAEAYKQTTERGRQTKESAFGLTWKGFIASLSIQEVRGNALEVLEKNPSIAFQEKDFVLMVLSEIFNPSQFEEIITSLFHGFLRTNIPNIEEIQNEEIPLMVFAIIKETGEFSHIQKVQLKEQNLLTLLDKPNILQYIKKNYLPQIYEYEKRFRDLYLLFKWLGKIGDFISKLEPEDTPSTKLKEYFNSLPKNGEFLENEI